MELLFFGKWFSKDFEHHARTPYEFIGCSELVAFPSSDIEESPVGTNGRCTELSFPYATPTRPERSRTQPHGRALWGRKSIATPEDDKRKPKKSRKMLKLCKNWKTSMFCNNSFGLPIFYRKTFMKMFKKIIWTLSAPSKSKMRSGSQTRSI